ncbi:MAG: hypothetical protein H6R01_1172 [Burkholderiaceae bacterium]|nr:hypothetical protein [Burkholderiaceae bacterium]
MKQLAIQRNKQRGAIIIVFTLSMLVLFGFMALVIDLGRIYVVRSELQNAADAAALAGAKDLDQTLAGVDRAKARAIAMAGQHYYQFSTPISITAANLSVGSCPEDACMVPISSIASNAQATGKTFLRVYIPSGSFSTFFARVPMTREDNAGITSSATYGEAVAGRYTNNAAPLGVCGLINTSTGATRPKGEALPGTNELAQFGFRHGVSYDIFNLNPLVPNSDPYLVNPVDTYPNACNPGNSSANVTAPFVCGGTSSALTSVPATVYGNTGISAGPIEAALNSRFNDFSAPSVCNSTSTPPDSNIRAFGCTGAGCATPAADWMTPAPAYQVLTPSDRYQPASPDDRSHYGVLWSYSRAVRANSATPPGPGTSFNPTTADWAALYNTPDGAPAPNTNFPASGSPYADPAHTTAPGGGQTGQPDRRVVNLMIIDCPNVVHAGACSRLPVLGVGRFFMQTPANFKGNPKKLHMEFAGLIEPFVSTNEIKLYHLRSCIKGAITDRDC